mmetsp:Transcript_6412/g.16618  ORF Transcript_6412/g.16618 Transcript_6412/m.16618 type:complete len:971 (-) Transcript_6412:115-3027(-)
MDEFLLIGGEQAGTTSPRNDSRHDDWPDDSTAPTPRHPTAPVDLQMAGSLLESSPSGDFLFPEGSIPELRAAQQAINEAARHASSFFRSLQAAIQPDFAVTNSSHTGAAAPASSDSSDSNDQPVMRLPSGQATALLPWTARTWHEQLFERQLAARMQRIADSPAVLLMDSEDSQQIDTSVAISDAAGAVLENDAKLRSLRFRLVPRTVSENAFWSRYFGECNRIRREVLSEGVPDSDQLEPDLGDVVVVATQLQASPQAVQRYGEEDAGRWLEEPPAAAFGGLASCVWSGLSGSLSGAGRRNESPGAAACDDLPFGMMSGDEGGLIPGGPSPRRAGAASQECIGASPMSPGDSSSTVIASGRSSLQSSTTSSMIREEPERERAMPVSSGPQLNPQAQGHSPFRRPPQPSPPVSAAPRLRVPGPQSVRAQPSFRAAYPPLGPEACRLRRMADTLAAAKLLSLEDMAKLSISPAAAHAEAKDGCGGTMLRAVGSARSGPTTGAAQDGGAQSLPPSCSAGAFAHPLRLIRIPSLSSSFSKSAAPRAEELASCSSDQVMAAVWELFQPMSDAAPLSPSGPSTPPPSTSPMPWGVQSPDASAELTGWSLEAEVGGAPASGLLAAIVTAACRLQTVGQMAQLWSEVLEELRLHWRCLRPVPLVPAAVSASPGACLLQQRLQLLNVAIVHSRQRRALAASASPDGAVQPVEGVLAANSREPLMTPELQMPASFPADLCQQFQALQDCASGPGAVLKQALSDMSAFRAANAGASPADYATWCAAEGRGPPRQLEALLPAAPPGAYRPLRHVPAGAAKGGAPQQLMRPSRWEDLFWMAPPLPAAKQTPLFNAEAVGAAVLDSLAGMPPRDVFEQLFLVAVVMEHSAAAASPLLHASPVLEAALHEVRAFATTTCGRGMDEHKISSLCHVFERLQDMFVAVRSESDQPSATGSRSGSALESMSAMSSRMEIDEEDEWTMI